MTPVVFTDPNKGPPRPPGNGIGNVALVCAMLTFLTAVGPLLILGVMDATAKPTANVGEGFFQALPGLAGMALSWFAVPVFFLATLLTSMRAMRTDEFIQGRISLYALLGITLVALGLNYKERQAHPPPDRDPPIDRRCAAKALAGELCDPPTGTPQPGEPLQLKQFKAK